MTATRTRPERYGLILLIALAGYAISGKGFAYLGVAPLYVTELVLAVGVLVMLQTGCMLASLMTVPSLILALLMVLTVLRTVPYVAVYGLDALRDSVLILYGMFAFVVSAMLLQRPERLSQVVRFLRWFTGIFVFVGPALYLINSAGVALPTLPGSGMPIVSVRAGELGVHLSACAVMAMTGLRPARKPFLCALTIGILIVAAQNRGGLLAILIPVMFAVPFTPAWRRSAVVGAAIVLVLGLGYALDVQLPVKPELQSVERPLGARQAVDNLLSLAAPTDDQQLDDTKMFRVLWWQRIEDYTFRGPYFWTGKGFGVNLAIDDGFVVGDPNGLPLRSPHNSHMNVLARTGVPGAVLWGAFLATWFGTMMSCAVRAWLRHDTQWGNLLLFIACYWLAAAIDASFDVALEAPMVGVWFWCLTGLGLGVQAIYRAGPCRDSVQRDAAGSYAHLAG